MAQGQWFVSSEGTRWWFDSGALSLDFAYTGSMSHNSAWEHLHSPGDLGAWLEGRFERYGDEPADRDLIDAKALRDAVGRLALSAASHEAPRPDDIDTINLFAATPDVPPALDGGSRQAGRSRIRTGQALSTIARDAVELFGHNTEQRIRECAADDCRLVFYDESRTNNRRWCSMQRCGNRAKVRAFRAKGTQQ
jgi:predicted RNA-binding Zn ribbon-like protein